MIIIWPLLQQSCAGRMLENTFGYIPECKEHLLQEPFNSILASLSLSGCWVGSRLDHVLLSYFGTGPRPPLLKALSVLIRT